MNKENIFSKSGIKSKKAKTNYFTGAISAKDISATIKTTSEKMFLFICEHNNHNTI